MANSVTITDWLSEQDKLKLCKKLLGSKGYSHLALAFDDEKKTLMYCVDGEEILKKKEQHQ